MKRRRREFHHATSLRPLAAHIADNNTAQQPGPPARSGRTQHENRQIIFGVGPVEEMIAAAPAQIRTLYVKQGAEKRFDAQIRVIEKSGGQVTVATAAEMARMAGSDARHQGIIAAVRDYAYVSLDQVLTRRPDPLLVLDGVTDPRNLGAILRTGECAGLEAVVLAKDRTVGLTPAAIKTSAGAWVHLLIARCGNVAQTLELLKRDGYWIAAMDPEGNTSLYDLDVTRRLALVLGSEGHGIREIVRKSADFVVEIPMQGRTGSLNVSVAAGIALFEIAHRRTTSGPHAG